jgi:hypothetical protein
MKKLPSHIARMKRSTKTERFSFAFGDLKVVRRSEPDLVIEIPVGMESLQRVVVNGEVFYRSGSMNQVVHVAPMKYTDEHFKEVNELQRSRFYSTTASLQEIAEKYNFNLDGFKRQYYVRGWHAPKKSTEK